MQRHSLAVFALVCVLLSTTAAAQEFWEKKDYQQWSRQECQRLLENSPWAVKRVVPLGQVTTRQLEVVSSGASGVPGITYVLQLRSVLPVRQAVVRRAQIEQGYDKLPAAEKRAFDTRVADFLSPVPSDNVLVHGTYGTEGSTNDLVSTLAKFWQSQTLATLKDKVALVTGDGRRIAPTGFTFQGWEFEFVFPRTLEGKPILSGTEKVLRLEMTLPIVNAFQYSLASGFAYSLSSMSRKLAVEFKVERMTYKGQLLF